MLLSQSQLIQMRRRWARGPTPPIPDEDIATPTTNNHHDNSPDNHHHSNSHAHRQSEPELDRPQCHARTPVANHDDSTSRQTIGDGSRSATVLLPTGEEEGEGLTEDEEFENLLMRESDLLREREGLTRKHVRDDESSGREGTLVRESEEREGLTRKQETDWGHGDDRFMQESHTWREEIGEHPRRKRDRDNSDWEEQGPHGNTNSDIVSGSQENAREQAKRSKFTCEEELEESLMDDLLADEEQLMLEMTDRHSPHL